MITVAKVLKHKPCAYYTPEVLQELIGDGITANEVLKKRINIVDKCWVISRFFPKNKMEKYAKKFDLVPYREPKDRDNFFVAIAGTSKENLKELADVIDGN